MKPSILTTILALAVAVLAYVNYTIIGSPVETSSIRQGLSSKIELSSKAAPKPQEATQDRPLSSLTETVKRPLFAGDRRPVVHVIKQQAEVFKPAAPITPPEQLRLVGVIQKPSPRALIRSSSNTLGSWIEVGDEVEGWRLQDVTEISVTIEAQNRKAELFLFSEGK